jgi:hypothetical protein
MQNETRSFDIPSPDDQGLDDIYSRKRRENDTQTLSIFLKYLNFGGQ